MFLEPLVGGRQGRLVVPSLLTWRFTTGWRRMISLQSTFRRKRDTIFSRTVKWSARTSGGADFGSEPRIVMPQASAVIVSRWGTRSEEHTSELQSRPHLVCRLLLEKKKQNSIVQPAHIGR